jgi:ABC-type multidrug transport system fused ATPase/permease subunit
MRRFVGRALAVPTFSTKEVVARLVPSTGGLVARALLSTKSGPLGTEAIPQGKKPGELSFMDTLKAILAEGKRARAEKKKLANGDAEAPAKLSKDHFKRLLSIIEPERRPISISVATLAATTSISLVFPAAIGQILDVALAPDATFTPGILSAVMLGLFGVQSALIVLRSSLLTVSGERMAASMRKDLFRALMAQDAAFFDSQKTGDLVNRLSSDTVVLQKALTSNVANGLRSAAMVVGGAGMLFYLSPSLALLSMGLIPPVALAGMSYGRYLQGQQKAVQEALGRTIDVASETISNLKTVRSFAAEALSSKRFGSKVDQAYLEARRIGIVAAGFDGAVHLAANISLIAVLGYGGHLVGNGNMTAGDLTAFLLYSTYTGFNISSLSNIYSDLKRAAGAASRIFEVIERAPEMPLSSDPHYWQPTKGEPPAPLDNPDNRAVVESDDSMWLKRRPQPLQGAAWEAVKGQQASSLITLPAVNGDISFKAVSFSYPTRKDATILKDFSLDIPSGSSICIVGGSGSGKSTLASLLVRLYDPQEGSITLDGHDLKALDPSWLRRQVALVSQEPSLFGTTIAE